MGISLLGVVSVLLKMKSIKIELSTFISILLGQAKPVKMEICPLAKQSRQAVSDFLAKLSRNEACGQLAFPLIGLCWAK